MSFSVFALSVKASLTDPTPHISAPKAFVLGVRDC